MQADAYAGYDRLYAAGRKPGPIVEAACWAHARRKFFDLARLTKAPIALEAIARIDALFAIERDLNGLPVNPVARSYLRRGRSGSSASRNAVADGPDPRARPTRRSAMSRAVASPAS